MRVFPSKKCKTMSAKNKLKPNRKAVNPTPKRASLIKSLKRKPKTKILPTKLRNKRMMRTRTRALILKLKKRVII